MFPAFCMLSLLVAIHGVSYKYGDVEFKPVPDPTAFTTGWSGPVYCVKLPKRCYDQPVSTMKLLYRGKESMDITKSLIWGVKLHKVHSSRYPYHIYVMCDNFKLLGCFFTQCADVVAFNIFQIKYLVLWHGCP